MAADQQGSCSVAGLLATQSQAKSTTKDSSIPKVQEQPVQGEKKPAACSADAEEKSSSFMSSDSTATAKRQDYISWDDYFVAVSFLSAMRSKDKRIVGIGYNGFPRGCSDDELPWARSAQSSLDTKYPYVVHAEVNAILNKNAASIHGCTLYVALFPCNECAKLIIQSGISEVVYLSDKYQGTDSMLASRRMLDMAGVTLRQHTPSTKQVVINFESYA